MVYYEFLYKPKKEGESELDALSRRMAFKLPIVVRYSIAASILFGILHSILGKNAVWIKRYMYIIPVTISALCYE